MSKRVTFVCSMCGGKTVTRDAWAEWDIAAQDWVLGAAYDYAFCHDCDKETHLIEVELEAVRRMTGDRLGPHLRQ